jgi:peroxiredoxin/Tfp pilus assembly protein PilF
MATFASIHRMFRFTLICCLILGPAALRADEPDRSGPDPGHSAHGEAFNEGPRQAAVLMGGTGKVDFPVSTRHSRAQRFFNQGVGQLHGFWYFEAERSFRQVLALDTNCIMAYWGMAMANVNNEKRAREFIQQAAAKKDKVTRREQLYIEGLAQFYKEDARDKKTRQRDYIRSLEAIVHEYPKDIEAKAILVWKIWELGSKDLPYSSTQAVDALIDQILQAEPMHPAHHYRIHIWYGEKDSRALASAARCGQAAPAIAHMWHMPGHTYSKLRRYADAAWQQEASARVDHAHMMKYWVLPDQIHNYAHNNEWLIRDLNLIGRVSDAVELAKNMIELPRHPKWNTLEKPRASASYGRARLLETLVRYELWDELIALADSPYLPPVTNATEEIKRVRALGLAHFNQGRTEQGRQLIARLEQLAKQDRASTNRVSSRPADTGGERDDEKDGPAAKKAVSGGKAAPGKKGPPAPRAAENALSELRGLLALAEGRKDEARKQLESSRDLPKDRLAQYYVKLGENAKAEQAIREAVRGASNEVPVLALGVEILARVGKTKEARACFEQLRKLSGHLDLAAPMFARLTELAPSLGVPARWQLPAPRPADVGRRPSLDSLGPVHWSPPKAPLWTLPGEEGRAVSLADYRGRPVIVFFYLGAACSHCVQQLNAFAPLVAEFRAAGIELVAIDGGPPADLARTHLKAKEGARFPFPLVCDEHLKVFKLWRCYDDFEQAPLHGTFLVDGDGAIRWLDISYQPFMDVKFLLAEAKRLLKLPKAEMTDAGSRKVARRGAP